MMMWYINFFLKMDTIPKINKETLIIDIKNNKFLLSQLEAQKKDIVDRLKIKCKEIKKQKTKVLMLYNLFPFEEMTQEEINRLLDKIKK